MKSDPGIVIAGLLTIVATAQQDIISSNDVLRTFSLIGAIGGALISSLITDSDGTAKRIVKFVGSVAAGFIFTPLVMRYFGIPVNQDTVMGMAGAVSFLSWGSLQVVIKVGPKITQRFMQDKIDNLRHSAKLLRGQSREKE